MKKEIKQIDQIKEKLYKNVDNLWMEKKLMLIILSTFIKPNLNVHYIIYNVV